MTHGLWQEEARKLGGNFLIQIIEELRDGQQEIIDRLDSMEKRSERSEALIENLNKAFPAGDLEGHKRYHELMMRLLEEKRRLRIAIQEKTISGLVWIVIVAIGSAVWKTVIALIRG